MVRPRRRVLTPLRPRKSGARADAKDPTGPQDTTTDRHAIAPETEDEEVFEEDRVITLEMAIPTAAAMSQPQAISASDIDRAIDSL